MRLVTRKVKKARERFKRRRQIKRLVVEAVAEALSPILAFLPSLSGRPTDRGLLDSGASCAPRQAKIGHNWSDGGTCRNKGEKGSRMYLCPYLEQTAYLGIDFWRIFGIAPEVVGSKVPVVAAIEKTQGMTKQVAHYVKDGVTRYETEAWEPEESQKLIVEEVNFKEVGLGKTHAEKHRIEWPAERPIADSLEWAWAYVGRGRLRATLDTDTSPMPTKICATSLDKSGINLRSGVASGSGGR
ncbi:hypothetical protein ACLKA6_008407 [Drosophila palustris]